MYAATIYTVYIPSLFTNLTGALLQTECSFAINTDSDSKPRLFSSHHFCVWSECSMWATMATWSLHLSGPLAFIAERQLCADRRPLFKQAHPLWRRAHLRACDSHESPYLPILFIHPQRYQVEGECRLQVEGRVLA